MHTRQPPSAGSACVLKHDTLLKMISSERTVQFFHDSQPCFRLLNCPCILVGVGGLRITRFQALLPEKKIDEENQWLLMLWFGRGWRPQALERELFLRREQAKENCVTFPHRCPPDPACTMLIGSAWWHAVARLRMPSQNRVYVSEPSLSFPRGSY